MTVRNVEWALLLGLIACQGGGQHVSTEGGNVVTSGTTLLSMTDVTQGEWDALASRRIFFGHQSVGVNIVQGIADVLADHPEVDLQIVDSKTLESHLSPGFYHAKVGRNEHPLEKVTEFAQLATQGLARPGSIGMVKFCYVDVRADTDPEELFEAYKDRISRLQQENPGLTIVHVTMPLTVAEDWWTYFKLKVRGYSNERDRNVVRNRYNDLLRSEYAGTGLLFDLAALESRRPDGSTSSFRRWGKMVYSLAPEYTDDGGHLNEAGRRAVAERLLVFLAGAPVPSRRPAPAGLDD